MKPLTAPSGNLSEDRSRLIPFLGGLCLFLSLVEYMIPKPLPFLRLGLANIPLMIGLTILTPRQVLLLALVKTTGQGIIAGTLLSYVFLFSLAGTAASVCTMMILYYLLGRHLSFVGIGLSGALASNMVQLVLASLFLFGEQARLMAPLFLVMGLIAGLVLGGFTEYFIHRSRWYAQVRGEPT